MRADEDAPELGEVRVFGVFHLDDAPRVLSAANALAIDFQNGIGTDHRERNRLFQLLILYILMSNREMKRPGLVILTLDSVGYRGQNAQVIAFGPWGREKGA